jgi:hypothetical protein
MRELTIRQPQEEIELADQVDLDVFGIGEHHRAEFLDSAATVILAAAATRTEKPFFAGTNQTSNSLVSLPDNILAKDTPRGQCYLFASNRANALTSEVSSKFSTVSQMDST